MSSGSRPFRASWSASPGSRPARRSRTSSTELSSTVVRDGSPSRSVFCFVVKVAFPGPQGRIGHPDLTQKLGQNLGRPPDPYRPPATPAGVINVTDPDSRNVKTSRGWVQGYNAQAVVTAEQIVIAADVTVDSPDFGHLEPMITAAQAELADIGITAVPDV